MKITTAGSSFLQVGHEITIAGVGTPDRRLWPRFRAWIAGNPPPMLDLTVFKVTQIDGSQAVLVEHEVKS